MSNPDFALLAAASYDDARRNEVNYAPIPPGWAELAQYRINGSGATAPAGGDGFSARVFRNGSGEIVISYAGTQFGGSSAGQQGDWLDGNGPLALGFTGSQAVAAATLYQKVLSLEGPNITFTGHSLGGGLAAMMGVLFNQPAKVFAPAPFKASVDAQQILHPGKFLNGPLTAIRQEMELNKLIHPQWIIPAALTSYNPVTDYAARVGNIQSWAVKGEVLEAVLPKLNLGFIENPGARTSLINSGATDLDMTSKHSIDLHAAALLSNTFSTVAGQFKQLLPLMFDATLYRANLVEDNAQDILVKLVRNEVGIRSDSGAVLQAANGMLTHFADDLGHLYAQKGSLSATAQDGIIAQAIEWYFYQPGDYSGDDFFYREAPYGILQYTTALGDELSEAQEEAALFTDKWLDPIANQHGYTASFDGIDQWNVATRAIVGVASAVDDSKTQLYVGSYGIDIFEGGDEDDVLLGGGGQDRLKGGDGDDFLAGGKHADELEGGLGYDTYSVGSGHDTITDDEAGEGQVRARLSGFTDYTFTGGAADRSNSWKSSDGRTVYVQDGSDLVIVLDGKQLNRTTIADFNFEMAKDTEYLGIHLQEKDEDDGPGPGAGGPGGGGAGGAAGGGISWFRKGDPLVLDLDGDGIELALSTSAVLFDHNADGIKTGTQWVKADDGMLVHDLNGNGSIDSGRELMGDQTIITTQNAQGQSVTTLAANGFAALAALDRDANGVADGVFDANDAAYGELKVWRDLNQDGVSQANELQTLADAGVTAINLTQTPTQVSQGKSTFTQTVAGVDDQGDPVMLSTSQTVQNINFRENTFVRAFSDDPVITAEAAALPQMRGAGLVRDLREAMSLGTPESTVLVGAIQTFKTTTRAQDRQNLLASVVQAWTNTSSMPDAVARNPVPDPPQYFSLPVNPVIYMITDLPENGIANFQNSPELYDRLTFIERIVGQPIIERYVRVSFKLTYVPIWGGSAYFGSHVVNVEPERLPFFQQAYDIFTADVYKSLYVQTAGKALLDQIKMVVDDKGLRHDFSDLNASFAVDAQTDPATAAVNLAEFIHFAGDSLAGSGWDGTAQLADLLQAHGLTAEQTSALNYLGFKLAGEQGSTADASLVGAGLADGLVGRAGNDTLNGAGGNDVLLGGAGNDVLYGGQGNDQLVGGSGQDYLNGQWGDDTYVWGAGQGNDTVDDLYANAGSSNTVVLRGLNPQEVRSEFLGANDYTGIKLTILTTGEALLVRNSSYPTWYGDSTRSPVNFLFADGTVWDMEEAMRQTVPMPTAGDDVIVGTHLDDRADRLSGGAGNDTLYGGDGNDVLEGGAGDDVLYGGAAWDTRETYYADANARRRAASNVDTYVFGRGDGNDTVINADRGVLDIDIIRFKEGVAPADIEVRQHGRNLVLSIQGTADSITVERYFEDRPSQAWTVNGGWTQGGIERFEFADGTLWTKADVDVMALAGSAQDDAIFGNASNNVLTGGQGNDLLQGGRGHETVQGDGGNDRLDGGIGNDLILGGEGDDTLEGGRGDDTLDGGTGNDVLFAGDGADTIRFGRGDGQDVLKRDVDFFVTYYSERNGSGIVNPGGNNAVEFKSGIAPSDVQLRRTGTNLELIIKGTTDVLKVESFYVNRGTDPLDMNFSLREIRFADGTVWGPQQMLAQMLVGDDSHEVLLGFGSDEVLDGQGGNDTLNGAGGHNTYRFGRGDGVDRVVFSNYSALGTLAFKEDVAPQDVQVRRVGNNAVFTIVGTGDSIAFDYAFPGYVSNGTALQFVAGVTFADGTVWTPAQVDQMAMQGTAGDDVIRDVPSTSETLLAGGAGNDVLIGERGNTVYVFNLGDGHDTLDENNSAYTTDTLRFGVGIVATDLNVSKLGKDLVIGINGTDDQVTIKNHSGTVIENFEVGGITLTYAQVAGLLDVDGLENLFGTSGDDILNGTGKVSAIIGFGGNDQLFGNDGDDVLEGGLDDDLLVGGAGQDQLNGGAGNDILKGGAGRDQLTGGEGANTYVFNRGDQLDTLVLTPGATEVITLGAGITPGQVTVQLGRESVWDGTQLVRQMVIGFGGNDAVSLAVGLGAIQQGGTSPLAGLNFADGTTWSFSDLLAHVDNGVAGSQTYYREDELHAIGSQGDDYISTTGSPNAYLEGRDNDDVLTAFGAPALVDGGNGNDVLYAANQAGLVLVGNWGNDEIFSPFAGGGSGEANTIGFNPGDGSDRLTGYRAAASVLSLGLGIEPADVIFQIDSEGDLVISFAGRPGDSIRMGWINPISGAARSAPAVDKLQFIGADGAVRLYDLVRPANGFDSPVLVHRPEPSPIFGGEAALAYAQTGNLKGAVYIAANNDPLGNKMLFGTPGDDVLTGGSGNDVLTAVDGNDLLLGAAGDDVLVGGAGDDVLDAGTGINKSYGGVGNDTYLYTRGNGSLVIEDGQFADGGEGGYDGFVGFGGYGGDINSLVFGEGVVFEDLTFSQDGTHLKVVVGGANANAGDEILLAGFDASLASVNQSIQSFSSVRFN